MTTTRYYIISGVVFLFGIFAVSYVANISIERQTIICQEGGC